jgi:hypothetical protein
MEKYAGSDGKRSVTDANREIFKGGDAGRPFELLCIAQ